MNIQIMQVHYTQITLWAKFMVRQKKETVLAITPLNFFLSWHLFKVLFKYIEQTCSTVPFNKWCMCFFKKIQQSCNFSNVQMVFLGLVPWASQVIIRSKSRVQPQPFKINQLSNDSTSVLWTSVSMSYWNENRHSYGLQPRDNSLKFLSLLQQSPKFKY